MKNPTNPLSKKTKNNTYTTFFLPKSSFSFSQKEGKQPRMTLKDPTSPMHIHTIFPMRPPKNIEKNTGATANNVVKPNEESNKIPSTLTLGK